MDLSKGHSFIATVDVVTLGYEGTLRTKPSQDLLGLDGGWLIRYPKGGKGMDLRFDFIEQVDDRFHFNISAASGSYSGYRLGVSRNGYLGFYSASDVSDFWKVEPLGAPESERSWRFFLRDQSGHRVGNWTQAGRPSELEDFVGHRSYDEAEKAMTFHYLNVLDPSKVIELRANVSTILS